MRINVPHTQLGARPLKPGPCAPNLRSMGSERSSASVHGVRAFHFADAFWFRVPVKVVVITITAFALVTIWPALIEGTSDERGRAIFALALVGFFVAVATTFAVAINESYIELDEVSLFVRFEAFFSATIPLTDITAVREIDPRPRWRFRFGLSTDFHERICCSHGGRLVEVELQRAWETRIWPRTIAVRRFWFAVKEYDGFLRDLQDRVAAARAGSPDEMRAAA